jgi:lipopolysaccharide export system protein LptC
LWRPRRAPLTAAALSRRSHFVATMKVTLPVAALGLVVVLIAWPQIYRPQEGIRLIPADIELSDNTLTMRNARYHGVDKKNRPYFVTADSATQDRDDPKIILLDEMQADMTLAAGNWLSLTANGGLYNQEAKTLILHGDVNVYSDDGYEFHATTAEIDLAAGTVASDDKVSGQGPFGLIDANGLRVYDTGKRVRFIKGVHTTLFPHGGK